MAGKTGRSIPRRRKAGLTNYHRRLKLLRSQTPRAVVRVSNTRTTCQLTKYNAGGDEVVSTMTGSDLVNKFGWPADFSQKSVPASYLVGFALGKSALKAGETEAVLDLGLASNSSGSRVYAALKGMADAGLNIPHDEDVLPSDERINGEHIDDKVAKAVEATRKKIEGAY